MFSKSIFGHFVLILSTLVMLSSACTEKSQTKERPNIIFIMSDDHTSQAVSVYGGRLASVCPTPNIDRLANEGMLFNNCFVTNSICTPSRAAIFTGNYAHVNGVYKFTALDQRQPTLPKVMQRSGYETAFYGKYHLHSNPVGIDHYAILPGQGRYHDPELIVKGNEHPSGWVGRAERTVFQGHSSDVITDRTLDYLKNQRDTEKPFMLFCQFKAPHDTWEYAERYESFLADTEIPEPSNLLDNYEGRSDALKTTLQYIGSDWGDHTNFIEETAHLEGGERIKAQYQLYMKKYLRCVKGVDDNVGRILDYLDESGLSENTLVIYTGDQGFYLGEHGLYDKRFMYEEGLRMPFLARWPGKIAPGSTNDGMILNVDLAPTIMESAGVTDQPSMQGRSFASMFEGNIPDDWRSSMYYRYYYSHFETEPHYGVRTHNHKLIYYNEIDQWEMYDVKNDPDEMNNLFDQPSQQETVKILQAELFRLQNELGDKPEDDGSKPNIGSLAAQPLHVAENVALGEGDKSVLIRFRTEKGGTLFSVGNMEAEEESDAFGWPFLKNLIITNNEVHLLYEDVEDVQREVVSEYNVTDGNWHTVALVLYGKQPKVYADGSLIYRYSTDMTADLKGHTFNIGGGIDDYGFMGYNFKGEISELLVYDEPLVEEALRQFANGERPVSEPILDWSSD